MRRISSELCDPLELRTDSLIGVPGLLQAARAGKVTIGNALGSGLVESDAFLSFLPSSEPLLPRRGARDAEPRDLVVRPGARARATCSSTSTSSSCGACAPSRNLFARGQDRLVTPETPADERERLIREIERNGHEFVGQEPMSLSLAPTWSGANALRGRAGAAARLCRGDRTRATRSCRAGSRASPTASDPRAPWLEARRRQQGHVGAVRSARRAVQPARAAPGEPAPAPRRPRSAEPHGRQPVLARPLHRARRRRRAPAAQPRDPAWAARWARRARSCRPSASWRC